MANETTLTIVGNLTADPELRVTANGSSVASFTVASTPRMYDRASGEFKDGDALFMRCSAWRDLADHIAESLQRGARVVVVGRLRQRSYDKDGQTRTVIELEADEVGPSLRYAVASVKKMQRSGGPQSSSGARQTADDPWSSGGRVPTGQGDDPPFAP